jgi:hypothetical protein
MHRPSSLFSKLVPQEKSFFDARMPAEILFDRCGIELGKVQHA